MANNPIFIIGGGTSLRNTDFRALENKPTIAINKAIQYINNPDYFITMDFTFLHKISNKLIEKNNKTTKIFIANFTKPYLKEVAGAIVDTRFPLTYDLHLFDVIIKSRESGGIGFSFKDFRNGENSGFCAFQLAVILGYNPIYLMGIDLVINEDNKKTHFHEGYNHNINRFKELLDVYYGYWKWGIEKLKETKPEIKVISLSPISRLNNIIPFNSMGI